MAGDRKVRAWPRLWRARPWRRSPIAAGQYAEAESAAREAREVLLETVVGRPALVPWMMITLGHALTGGGKLDEAESLLHECVRIVAAWRLPRVYVHMLGGEARSVLGECLTAQGRYDEAEPLLLEGYNMIRKVIATRRTQAASAHSRLVELYEAWHTAEPNKAHDARAAEWRARLPSVQSELIK